MSETKGHIDYNKIAKYLNGEASEVDSVWIETELSKSVEFRKEFEKAQKTWEIALLAKQERPYDSASAFEKLSQQLDDEEKVIKIDTRKKVGILELTLRWAAIVLLLATSIFVMRLILGAGDPILYETTTESMEIELEDGSSVILSQHSQLIVDGEFENLNRSVMLEGEAYFEVESGKLPFKISAGKGIVEVVGTKFLVDAKVKDSVKVSVAEGVVKVFKKGKAKQAKEVIKNQKAVIASAKDVIISESVEVANELYTYTRTLVFRKSSLNQVVKMLNHNFDEEVVLSNPDLEECQLTATFEKMELEQIIEIICETLNLNYRIENRQYIIEGNSC